MSHETPLPQCEIIHNEFEKHKEESVPIRDSVKRSELLLSGISEETKEIFNRLRKVEFDSAASLVLSKSVDERVTRHKSDIDRFIEGINKAMLGNDKEKGLFTRVQDVEAYMADQKKDKKDNWNWLIHSVGYVVISIILGVIALKLGISH